MEQEKTCEGCAYRQKSYAHWLCCYGVMAVPEESMTHPRGMCGPERNLYDATGDQR